MKSIFIVFDQGFYHQVLEILYINHHVRGFTSWERVLGRGSKTGEPHYGTHAWPSLNGAILTVVPDEKVKPAFKRNTLSGVPFLLYNVSGENRSRP